MVKQLHFEKVNAIAPARIIKHFYPSLIGKPDFYTCIIGSIAGLVSSPLFSIYGATKAAVCKFTESINIELEKHGNSNRILNVSPGSIKGTRFHGGENNLKMIEHLASNIVDRMLNHEEFFIPEYEEVYKGVLDRYHHDPHEFGLQSFDYKTSKTKIEVIEHDPLNHPEKAVSDGVK